MALKEYSALAAIRRNGTQNAEEGVVIHIETISQLRGVWSHISKALSRDLSSAADLAIDPIATLRRHGFAVSADAASALLLALP